MPRQSQWPAVEQNSSVERVNELAQLVDRMCVVCLRMIKREFNCITHKQQLVRKVFVIAWIVLNETCRELLSVDDGEMSVRTARERSDVESLCYDYNYWFCAWGGKSHNITICDLQFQPNEIYSEEVSIKPQGEFLLPEKLQFSRCFDLMIWSSDSDLCTNRQFSSQSSTWRALYEAIELV